MSNKTAGGGDSDSGSGIVDLAKEISIDPDQNPIVQRLRIDKEEIEDSTDDLLERISHEAEQISEIKDDSEEFVGRKVAVKIVEEECQIPLAKRVLWVDETEPYFLCVDCFHDHQERAWSGNKKHPNFTTFQSVVHERLQDGIPCEYCREKTIIRVAKMIHSDLESDK